MRNAGKLVAQKQLLQEVWGPAYETETNYLRVFMAQVRRKLEPEPGHPRYFFTEPGMGYRFEVGESADDPRTLLVDRLVEALGDLLGVVGSRAPSAFALRRCRSTSITAGRTERRMITAMIGSRYLSMLSAPIWSPRR